MCNWKQIKPLGELTSFFILKHYSIRIIIYSIGSLLEMTSLRDTESNENPDTRNGLSILPSITTSSPSEATGEILSTSSETPTSDQIEFYIDFSTIFPSDTLKEYVCLSFDRMKLVLIVLVIWIESFDTTRRF